MLLLDDFQKKELQKEVHHFIIEKLPVKMKLNDKNVIEKHEKEEEDPIELIVTLSKKSGSDGKCPDAIQQQTPLAISTKNVNAKRGKKTQTLLMKVQCDHEQEILHELAKRDDVLSIRRKKLAKPLVLASTDTKKYTLRQNSVLSNEEALLQILNAHSISGEGQIVAIADTGLDFDHCAFGSNSKDNIVFCQDIQTCQNNNNNAIDPNARIVSYRTWFNSSVGDEENGHGTHVTGIALAGADILGMAPSAKMAIEDCKDERPGVRETPSTRTQVADMPKLILIFACYLQGYEYLQIPDDLNDFFAPAYQYQQAKIHSNSWGALMLK